MFQAQTRSPIWKECVKSDPTAVIVPAHSPMLTESPLLPRITSTSAASNPNARALISTSSGRKGARAISSSTKHRLLATPGVAIVILSGSRTLWNGREMYVAGAEDTLVAMPWNFWPCRTTTGVVSSPVNEAYQSRYISLAPAILRKTHPPSEKRRHQPTRTVVLTVREQRIHQVDFQV